MKILYFTHSLLSCWNHGNAHFQRGLLRELKALGHQASAMEPVNSWSLSNLMADHGEAGLSAFRNAYPELSTSSYDPARFDAEQVVRSEEHTSELQSLMRIAYAVFCLKHKITKYK